MAQATGMGTVLPGHAHLDPGDITKYPGRDEAQVQDPCKPAVHAFDDALLSAASLAVSGPAHVRCFTILGKKKSKRRNKERTPLRDAALKGCSMRAPNHQCSPQPCRATDAAAADASRAQSAATPSQATVPSCALKPPLPPLPPGHASTVASNSSDTGPKPSRVLSVTGGQRMEELLCYATPFNSVTAAHQVMANLSRPNAYDMNSGQQLMTTFPSLTPAPSAQSSMSDLFIRQMQAQARAAADAVAAVEVPIIRHKPNLGPVLSMAEARKQASVVHVPPEPSGSPGGPAARAKMQRLSFKRFLASARQVFGRKADAAGAITHVAPDLPGAVQKIASEGTPATQSSISHSTSQSHIVPHSTSTGHTASSRPHHSHHGLGPLPQHSRMYHPIPTPFSAEHGSSSHVSAADYTGHAYPTNTQAPSLDPSGSQALPISTPSTPQLSKPITLHSVGSFPMHPTASSRSSPADDNGCNYVHPHHRGVRVMSSRQAMPHIRSPPSIRSPNRWPSSTGALLQHSAHMTAENAAVQAGGSRACNSAGSITEADKQQQQLFTRTAGSNGASAGAATDAVTPSSVGSSNSGSMAPCQGSVDTPSTGAAFRPVRLQAPRMASPFLTAAFMSSSIDSVRISAAPGSSSTGVSSSTCGSSSTGAGSRISGSSGAGNSSGTGSLTGGNCIDSCGPSGQGSNIRDSNGSGHGNRTGIVSISGDQQGTPHTPVRSVGTSGSDVTLIAVSSYSPMSVTAHQGSADEFSGSDSSDCDTPTRRGGVVLRPVVMEAYQPSASDIKSVSALPAASRVLEATTASVIAKRQHPMPPRHRSIGASPGSGPLLSHHATRWHGNIAATQQAGSVAGKSTPTVPAPPAHGPATAVPGTRRDFKPAATLQGQQKPPTAQHPSDTTVPTAVHAAGAQLVDMPSQCMSVWRSVLLQDLEQELEVVSSSRASNLVVARKQSARRPKARHARSSSQPSVDVEQGNSEPHTASQTPRSGGHVSADVATGAVIKNGCSNSTESLGTGSHGRHAGKSVSVNARAAVCQGSAADRLLAVREQVLQYAIAELQELEHQLSGLTAGSCQAEELQASCLTKVLSAVQGALDKGVSPPPVAAGPDSSPLQVVPQFGDGRMGTAVLSAQQGSKAEDQNVIRPASDVTQELQQMPPSPQQQQQGEAATEVTAVPQLLLPNPPASPSAESEGGIRSGLSGLSGLTMPNSPFMPSPSPSSSLTAAQGMNSDVSNYNTFISQYNNPLAAPMQYNMLFEGPETRSGNSLAMSSRQQHGSGVNVAHAADVTATAWCDVRLAGNADGAATTAKVIKEDGVGHSCDELSDHEHSDALSFISCEENESGVGWAISGSLFGQLQPASHARSSRLSNRSKVQAASSSGSRSGPQAATSTSRHSHSGSPSAQGGGRSLVAMLEGMMVGGSGGALAMDSLAGLTEHDLTDILHAARQRQAFRQQQQQQMGQQQQSGVAVADKGAAAATDQETQGDLPGVVVGQRSRSLSGSVMMLGSIPEEDATEATHPKSSQGKIQQVQTQGQAAAAAGGLQHAVLPGPAPLATSPATAQHCDSTAKPTLKQAGVTAPPPPPGPPPPPPPCMPPAPLVLKRTKAGPLVQNNKTPAAPQGADSIPESSKEQPSQCNHIPSIPALNSSQAAPRCQPEVSRAAAGPTNSINRYPNIVTLHQELRRVLLGYTIGAPRAGGNSKTHGRGQPSTGAAGLVKGQMLDELASKSSYQQEVIHQAMQFQELLYHWAQRITTAELQQGGMPGVVDLVKQMDTELGVLCDEGAVIKRLTEASVGTFTWPESRCDTLRLAAALHVQLTNYINTLSSWELNTALPLASELTRITKYHEQVVKRMDELNRDRDKLAARFKEARVPWSWDILKQVQQAALCPLHTYLSAVLQQTSNTGTTPATVQHAPLKNAAITSASVKITPTISTSTGGGTTPATARQTHGVPDISQLGRREPHSLQAVHSWAQAEAASSQASRTPAERSSQAPVKLLDDAITFAFRVHQFVGGFDTACAQVLDQLAPLWRAVRQTRLTAASP